MLALFIALTVRGDGWSFWSSVPLGGGFPTASAKLATDGTNIYYSTLLSGVWRASLADRSFTQMPLTGFPIWDGNTNTNGFAVWNLATTPQGTVVISGSPVNVTSNGISPPPSSFNNTLPVFYWWDETNQLWHAAAVSNKSYPYTTSAGDFSVAPDGSLWTCSGFATYAYRSTDGGRSYTAFDINARVPTNYFPLPFTANQFTFGKVFSIVAGQNNQVVIGTETGGYLHTTNNGLSWASLDPNYTNTNSPNPLGRIGNCVVAGLDHYGNFLCGNFEFGSQFPGETNWAGVQLIGWRPADNSYFNASSGFPANFGAPGVVTPPSGVSFTYMNQNYLLQGGVYRSPNGRNWSQFNTGSPLELPFAEGITNAVAAGNCITTLSNLVFIGFGSSIYVFDSTPPSVVNRPPVAVPQSANLWENSPTNLVLTGKDADGDALNFSIVVPPQRGTLTGVPPNITYKPNTNFAGLDLFWFSVNDGSLTSAPAIFNLAVNATTNQPPVISFTSPLNGSWCVGPTNILLSAIASDNDGPVRVNFYDGTNLLAAVTNAPYEFLATNVSVGEHTFFSRATDKFSIRTWAQPAVIQVLPIIPRLDIKQVDSVTVAVIWPLELDGFFIESAATLDGPWTLSPYAPLFFPSGQSTAIPAGDQQFFRLMRP